MQKNSLVMMPWFPRDFMSSTRGWPLAARGAYRELLDAQWDMGTLPTDPMELKALVGATDAEWALAWPKIEPKLPINCDGRKNAKLEEHRQKSYELHVKRSQAGQRANAIRWQSDPLAIPNGSHPSPSPSPSPIRAEPKTSDTGADAPQPKPKRVSRARTQIPPDFSLDARMTQYALDRLADMDTEATFRDFRDYHLAKGTVGVDWGAAWRTWINNCVKGFAYVRRNGPLAEADAPRLTPAEWRSQQKAKAEGGSQGGVALHAGMARAAGQGHGRDR